jgi:hypothetical protein
MMKLLTRSKNEKAVAVATGSSVDSLPRVQRLSGRDLDQVVGGFAPSAVGALGAFGVPAAVHLAPSSFMAPSPSIGGLGGFMGGLGGLPRAGGFSGSGAGSE